MTVKLNVQGAGDPVVFLHGTPTRPDVFSEFAREVARTRTAIEVALPGYGESEPLADGWTYADMHEAVEQSLVARGFRDVSLIGFSGGGYHALALAIRKRVNVKGIVALGSLANLTDEERTRYRDSADLIANGADLSEPLHEAFFAEGWRHRPGMKEVTLTCLAATSKANLAAELRNLARSENLLPKLKTLDIPIVARHGTADQTVVFAKSEQIADFAPRGVLEPVEHAGHMLLLEDFNGTLTSIQRALQKT
jgi:pimeloyl-ACP methyl ester carboxylesterase